MFTFYTHGDSWSCSRSDFQPRATCWRATHYPSGTVIRTSTKDRLTDAIRRHYV